MRPYTFYAVFWGGKYRVFHEYSFDRFKKRNWIGISVNSREAAREWVKLNLNK